MKKIFTMFVLSMFVLSSVALVSAFHNRQMSYNLKVFEKDDDWNIVKHGAKGNVLFTKGDRVHSIVRHLNPYTDYTLIYYGDATHNDEWAYATCITSKTTNKRGNARMPKGSFDYSGFVDDGIGQKFWIVLSSDVDCSQGIMTNWEPQEYLFEHNVI